MAVRSSRHWPPHRTISWLNPPMSSLRAASRRRGALHLSRRDWPNCRLGSMAGGSDRHELTQRIPGIESAVGARRFRTELCGHRRRQTSCRVFAALPQAWGTDRNQRGPASADYRERPGVVSLANGNELTCAILVNAAGAWADRVAQYSGVEALGIAPKRRTMVQLRVGRSGLKDLPLINDSDGNFYFKGETDRSIWLSPHDEVDCAPCDAVPEEIDVATAVGRFETVVDWPVETVERSWAGLQELRFGPAAGLRLRCSETRILLVRRPGRLRYSDGAGRGKACCRARARRGAATKRREYRIRHLSPSGSAK